MLQHQLLMLVAAPLLVLGRPTVCLWVLPQRWRRPLERTVARLEHALRCDAFGTAFAAMIVCAAALTVWHLPPVYQAALQNDAIHVAEHLSLLAAALVLWNAVMQIRIAPRVRPCWSCSRPRSIAECSARF